MNENNKLIAEFMGLYEKHPLGSFFINGSWYAEHEFKYHSSWDWLMPVVENCRETSKTYQKYDALEKH